MKILKPGKVEMRKFVCNKCGCIFVCNTTDNIAYREPSGNYSIYCPVCRLPYFTWESGEPYEDPAPTQTDRERLRGLLQTWDWNHADTGGLDTFLLERGVTFREGQGAS